MQMVEELKLKKNVLADLKKENIDFEAKLKQQSNLYESVRSEKNLYSKNLLEAQDDVAELNRKFKIAQHQITQLKEEIEAKDQALTAEHFDHGMSKKTADLYNVKL
jgi:chromosome segregation ATPase